MSAADTTIAVESDWLPSAELIRLLLDSGRDLPGIDVTAELPEHRGLDPATAVALVGGTFNVIVPFVTEFAKRIFRAEPGAAVAVDRENGDGAVVLLSSLPEEARAELVAQAIKSGALRMRISLEPRAD